MKKILISSITAILFLVWVFYAWQNREFIFENENSPQDLVAHPLPTTPSKEVGGPVGRENIFEYGGEGARKEVEAKKQKPEIIYTVHGFDPAVLHVKQGESVTFLNRSGKLMKLVSDYADFPSPKEVANGESYKFTFNKKGYWSIGNADNASLMAVVSVE